MKVSPPSLRLSTFRARWAFTLVEMLVVIGIIALLAAMIVGVMPAIVTKKNIARVEAEREALITFIEAYHKAKGFYPPGNSVDTNETVQTTLFYELTGATLTNLGGPSFVSPYAPQQPVLASSLTTAIGVSGILNASGDPSEVKNFCAGLKATQYGTLKLNPPLGNFIVFGVAIDGAKGTNWTDRGLMAPWHYNSANPTNNPDSYDLWVDVVSSGSKTNRFSNWSKDPQPLGP